MKNFKMIVSYDGTRYFGWEHQPDTDMTIQGKLEKVLSQMQEMPEGQSVTVIGAGRTDAGVHARAMTCNVLLDTESRFKAIGKTYRYTCWYGSSKPVFDRRYVTVLEREPDIERMQEAAEYLTGMHDYKSFCGNARMKKSTIRVVDVIRIEQSGNYIRFYFHGNGFLQNMVRIMTGTLLEVGFGKKDPEDMARIIEAKDRQAAGFTAPAQGLCLMKVDY